MLHNFWFDLGFFYGLVVFEHKNTTHFDYQPLQRPRFSLKEMELDMGGGRGGLRGFSGAVEEEEEDRGLLECSVCEVFF